MSSIASGSLLASLLKDYKSSLSSSGSSAVSNVASSIDSNATASLSSSDAYILDLSQAAQEIINSQNNSGIQSTISLSDSQKQKLQTIFDKYKDAPANNDTLSALGSDLQQAGLTPEELAAVQQAKIYNPLKSLLNILFTDSYGKNSSTDNALSSLSSASSNSPIGELLQQNLLDSQVLSANSNVTSS